jgi:peptidoglycan/LPS O-acetylase OafA/YrhL
MIRAPSLGRSLIGPGLLRLFLALVVFVDHASRLALGPAAVKVFFCLSGFWIYRIWTERYVRCRDPYITYVISRVWRVIPTFLLIVLITLICLHYALGQPWAAMRGSANWTQFVASHILPLLRIGWVGAFPVSDIPMFG